MKCKIKLHFINIMAINTLRALILVLIAIIQMRKYKLVQ